MFGSGFQGCPGPSTIYPVDPYTLSSVQAYPHRGSPRQLVLTVLLLSEKLSGIKLEVEEISLTSASQRRKLEVILEATNRSLQVEEQWAKWSVESTWGLSQACYLGGEGRSSVLNQLGLGRTQRPQAAHRVSTSWTQSLGSGGGETDLHTGPPRVLLQPVLPNGYDFPETQRCGV